MNTQHALAFGRKVLWHYAANRFAASAVWPVAVRARIYHRLGLRTADLILHGCSFSGPNVHFEPEAAVGAHCVFDEEFAPIWMGEHAALSPRVSLITTTHQISVAGARNSGRAYGREIRIERNAWVCYGATVMPGVTVGEGCIVGVGAVVTKDCEPNGLYAGNPAVRVRDLPVRRAQPGRPRVAEASGAA